MMFFNRRRLPPTAVPSPAPGPPKTTNHAVAINNLVDNPPPSAGTVQARSPVAAPPPTPGKPKAAARSPVQDQLHGARSEKMVFCLLCVHRLVGGQNPQNRFPDADNTPKTYQKHLSHAPKHPQRP